MSSVQRQHHPSSRMFPQHNQTTPYIAKILLIFLTSFHSLCFCMYHWARIVMKIIYISRITTNWMRVIDWDRLALNIEQKTCVNDNDDTFYSVDAHKHKQTNHFYCYWIMSYITIQVYVHTHRIGCVCACSNPLVDWGTASFMLLRLIAKATIRSVLKWYGWCCWYGIYVWTYTEVYEH